MLDADEKHPSLRLHQLEGRLRGSWSVSVNMSLRVTFTRLDDGRKQLEAVSRHYDR